MNKRPLCLMCICFMAVLWLSDITGLSKLWEPAEYQLLQEQANARTACRLTGDVRKYETKENSIYIYLENTLLYVQSEQYSPKQLLIKYSGQDSFAVGDTLTIEGSLDPIQEASNPGQFDARAYYRARNILFTIRSEVLHVEKQNAGLRNRIYQIKERIAQSLTNLEPNDDGVLKAMLLGDKGALTQEMKVKYQMSGISHILAISGLHLSLLGMGLYHLLMKAGANHYSAGGIAIIFLFCYGILTGESVSVLRAMLMFALQVGARFVGRTYDLLSAVALAAILILVEYPGYLYDSGFLLSFLAILSLGGVLPVLQSQKSENRKDFTRVQTIKNHIKSGLLSGMVIWIVTLPIVLFYFYEVSVYGILLNLFVIPTMAIVLISGGLGGILGIISPLLGQCCIAPALAVLNSYNAIGEWVQIMPWSTVIMGKPEKWRIGLYYLILISFLLCYQRFLKKNKAGWKRGLSIALTTGILLLVICVHQPKGLSITAVDVGQGDSLVISAENGCHYLIDGGSSSVNQVGTYRILPFLKSQGIRCIDTVFISHPDEDHINGIIELFESVEKHQTSLKVNQCVLPVWMKDNSDAKVLRESAKKAGIDVAYVQKGDVIYSENITFQVLHPGKKSYDDNPNAGSLTLKLKYQDFTGVFTGDLCEDGEEAVQEIVGQCQLLKVAHHGSKYSTDEGFLQTVKPVISIISAGKDNRYGHPHAELLDRLEAVKSSIFSTAEGGAVTVWTDGKEQMKIVQFNPGN